MKKLKRGLRLVALVLMILVASFVPLPIGLFQKDLPKNHIEQVDPDDEE